MNAYRSLALALTFVGASIAHADQMSFKLQSERGGGTQFRLIGDDLCRRGNAESFSIYKGRVQNQRFADAEKYVSKSNKDEWRVTNSCTINQELSQDLMQPGKALRIKTMDRYGIVVNDYYIEVPCQKELVAVEKDRVFYSDLSLMKATVCDDQKGGQLIVKDAEDIGTITSTNSFPSDGSSSQQTSEKQQACSLKAEVDKNDTSLVKVYAGCDFQDTLNIRVLSNGLTLTSVIKQITQSRYALQHVTSFRRDTQRSLTVELAAFSFNDVRELQGSTKTIYKQATFNSPTRVNLFNDKATVPAQDKLLGRGRYYEFDLEMVAYDSDIEDNFPQREILVQLINTTQGKNTLVEERRISSNQKASFTLTGQYIVPTFFGENHWSESEELKQGDNTFTLRVYDAFSNSKYIDYSGIRLTIN